MRVERGDRIRLTPPATASSHSPRRSAWAARWTATSPDEHAVSTAIAGPWNPIAYASRPAAKLCPLPVAQYRSGASGCQSR